jgi:hypothetical protein
VNAATRRAIAYIGGRAASKHTSSSLFDYSTGKYFSFSGSVSETGVSIYDFEAQSQISGSRRGNKISLFDYGVGSHIDLRLDRSGKISGYDYASGSHFSGTVTGRAISLYDYGSGQYYQYGI